MISQYSCIRLNLYNLLNLARVYFTDASLQDLAEVAQTLRYEGVLVRKSLINLDSYYNPSIANWQVIHHVVVWIDKCDRILISDPAAIYKMWLSHPKFEGS